PDSRVGHSALLRSQGRLTLVSPAGAADDVMVVSIALRGSSQDVTPPAGWPLVRKTVGNTDSHSTSTTLFVYRKAATAADVGASYDFTAAGGIDGVGGIVAYRGVETSDPIAGVENGIAATSSGNT